MNNEEEVGTWRNFQKLMSCWLMIELDWVAATEESPLAASRVTNQVFRVS